MECFTIFADEIEGRLNPAYYKNKNPFLKSKYELVDIEDYFLVNPKFQNKDNLKIVSFLPMKNINPELQEVDKFDKIEIEKIKGYTPFEEGDLVFAKVTPCMENGNLAICENMPFRIGVGTSEIYVFREKQKKIISNKFLKNLFSLEKFRQFAKNNFTGTGGLQRVPRDFFNNLKIPFPPLPIQNKIVQLMDSAYSSKKSKESEALKLLDSLNDYVLDELEIKLPELEDKMIYVVDSEEVQNKRADAYYYQPKFEEIEKAVKKGKFEVKELRDSLDYHKKGIEVGSNAYIDEGVPFIRVADIDDYKIKYDETDKKIKLELYEKLKEYQPKKDELLFSKDGSVGFCVVVNENKDSIISGGILRLKVKKSINNFYIKAILSSKFFKILTERESIGSIIKHLTPEVLLSLKIPLPTLAVQNKIAEEVKKRMQKAESLQKEAKEELEKAKLEVEKIILG